MARSTIMMVGIGDLGGHVLEMLVRSPGPRRIITADINEEAAKMVMYEKMFQGMARFMNTQNDLLEHLMDLV